MVNYVYICSAGHSGSTLLDLLIGSHSKVASLGEVFRLPSEILLDSLCTCGEKIRYCAVWERVLKRIGKRLNKNILKNPHEMRLGYPVSSGVVDKSFQTNSYIFRRKLVRGLNYLQLRYNLESLSNFVARFNNEDMTTSFLLGRAFCEVQGVNIVVDSSKDYLRCVELYLRDPDNVRIIFLSRDGRGVLYSNLKRKEDFKNSAKQWSNFYTRAFPLIDLHVKKNHVLSVKYESLVESPIKVLSNICDFIGIEFEPNMLNYRSHHHHSINGNDIRFGHNSDIKPDTLWKEKLTNEECRDFNSIAGRINKKLGYI